MFSVPGSNLVSVSAHVWSTPRARGAGAAISSTRTASSRRIDGERRGSSAGAAQVAQRAPAQLAHELGDERGTVVRPAVGDGADDAALALDQRGHRLVDRVRGEQVPG